jgi:rhamnogalacturonan endolyase
MRVILLALLLSIVFNGPGYSQATPNPKLIFSDDFTTPLDSNLWITEIAPPPGFKVYTKDGNLILDTKGGVTVWLNKKLSGNILIESTRTVLIDSGANDRLSDLNMFWMATDPKSNNLFTRNGVLESYDSLQLYYVGMGGNTNSTTRFRKYEGNGNRTLLKEYKDPAHLLQPNKRYTIVIEVRGNIVRYIVDGEVYFEYNDPAVLKEGYFGFRSTKSRQAIDTIKIYQLE